MNKDEDNIFEEDADEENTWTPDYSNEEDSNSSEDEQQEIESVSWSKKKTGAVVMTLIFIALIIAITVKSCSITKREKNGSNVKSTVTMETGSTYNISSNNGEKDSNKSENSSESVGSDSSAVEEGKTEESSSSSTTEVTIVDKTSTEAIPTNEETVDTVEPSLGEALTTSAIVSGKKVHLVEDNYLYDVRLLFVVGNGDSRLCSYFCPRKTYDALSTGDTVTVEYQLDAEGNMSITTISK